MEPIPPGSESVHGLEMRPGEDFMDYLDRHAELNRRKGEKTMAEFRAVAQSTKETLEEVVFHCDRAGKVWDETTARIEAIRAQDGRKRPSTQLPPGSR